MAQDIEKALVYLQQSADAGNASAQYILGKLYLTGQNIAQDKDTARFWLTQAADQDHPYAALLLERMAETETPAAALSITRLLHHISRIFQDNSLPQSSSGGIQIDHKRLQKLREKKIALGHKADDHEDLNYTVPL